MPWYPPRPDLPDVTHYVPRHRLWITLFAWLGLATYLTIACLEMQP
jgi:hypothetical protein